MHDVGTTLQELFIAGLSIGSVEIEETGVGLEKEPFTNSFSDVHEMRVFLIHSLNASIQKEKVKDLFY